MTPILMFLVVPSLALYCEPVISYPALAERVPMALSPPVRYNPPVSARPIGGTTARISLNNVGFSRFTRLAIGKNPVII